MTEHQEDLLKLGYWGAVEEDADDGFAKEQARMWRNYYLRKLGMLAITPDD